MNRVNNISGKWVAAIWLSILLGGIKAWGFDGLREIGDYFILVVLVSMAALGFMLIAALRKLKIWKS